MVLGAMLVAAVGAGPVDDVARGGPDDRNQPGMGGTLEALGL